jgi:hypothetical protein
LSPTTNFSKSQGRAHGSFKTRQSVHETNSLSTRSIIEVCL